MDACARANENPLCMDLTPLFAFTDGDRWRLGIGDPTVMGWFTVLAYFAAGFLCWRAAKKGLHTSKVRWFWTAIAVLLIFLGINKQLDLQTAFTFMAKDFAKATGWYENRRVVQGIFVVLIAFGGMLATAALFWFYRNELKRLWPALAGLAFLGSFVVIQIGRAHV